MASFLQDPRHRDSGGGVVKSGGKSWLFLTAEYILGTTMEHEASEVIKANGGPVLSSVRHPLNATDYSSLLLQAQNSEAQIIGLAKGGTDTINAIRTAGEFNIVSGGQKLTGLTVSTVRRNVRPRGWASRPQHAPFRIEEA